MNKKFIWWKGVALGPFSDENLQKLNWDAIEVCVDSLLKTDFKRTPPLSPNMKANPDIPHIFLKL